MSYPSSVPRSVYVLGDGLLFDEIIAYMLMSDARLRVIRGFSVEDAAFLALVCLCQPELILLNESDLFRCERIRTVLPQISPAADLKVIVIRPDNNFVHIFDWAAGQVNRRTGATLTLKRIMGWNEMLDLVGEGAWQFERLILSPKWGVIGARSGEDSAVGNRQLEIGKQSSQA